MVVIAFITGNYFIGYKNGKKSEQLKQSKKDKQQLEKTIENVKATKNRVIKRAKLSTTDKLKRMQSRTRKNS